MITYIKNFLSSLFKRRLFKGAPGRNDEAWAKLIVSHVNMAVEEERARTSIEALAEKCLDVHSRVQAQHRELKQSLVKLEQDATSAVRTVNLRIDMLIEESKSKKRKLRKTSKKR